MESCLSVNRQMFMGFPEVWGSGNRKQTKTFHRSGADFISIECGPV
jgi:hypothetical protein